jgi:hypothetical protein
MRIPLIASCLLLACAGVAQADLIILKHGGKISGTIVKQSKRTVTVRIRGGGTMSLPRGTIKRVETRASAESKYSDRVMDVNFNDPNAIEQLALWASTHGLGDKAKELEAMAQGLRLEVMIDRAKKQRRAQAYVDIFYWARSVGLSDEVQNWVLAEARALDPDDVALKGAVQHRQRIAREEAKAAARLAEFNRRPRYRMPSSSMSAGAPPTAAQMRSTIATERTRLRSRKPPQDPVETKAWLERARKARAREAEAALGLRNARRKAEEGR